MAIGKAELFAFLAQMDIAVKTVEHEPLFTVAQSQALRGQIPGGHTKNLFLKDKKDNYFLLTVDEEAEIDLKQIHKAIGAASRVSFGKAEAMESLLGVTPGAVTAFGVINDKAGAVRFFIDESLLSHEVINCHPLVNTATTSIAPADLIRFIEATGHRPNTLNLAAQIAN
ncbi:MAG: YbaK/EbsC family protein [Zhengella sp.]|uniref:prolyl-tRNA synthetase associated domain-containing protein n=1 Tax=Zhengella sp. TaxID=2282762 RepID=UPI001E13A4F1|nr:prolyl-tRNA synthetase associated domain-containing protein [Notoacmeibacter sp.]MCC0028317.1 prolyl-tRNA synthetase associated domain-containing protein [Brucellaceae bacterium]